MRRQKCGRVIAVKIKRMCWDGPRWKSVRVVPVKVVGGRWGRSWLVEGGMLELESTDAPVVRSAKAKRVCW